MDKAPSDQHKSSYIISNEPEDEISKYFGNAPQKAKEFSNLFKDNGADKQAMSADDFLKHFCKGGEVANAGDNAFKLLSIISSVPVAIEAIKRFEGRYDLVELLTNLKEGALDDKKTCGDNCCWKIEDNILFVCGTGDMDSYNSTGAPWNSSCKSVEIVIIADGVTNVGICAFAGFVQMKLLALPKSVTRIEKFAFSGCTSLETVLLPSALEYIGDDAFFNCESLNKITLPKNVNLGNGPFERCRKLLEISTHGCDNVKVTENAVILVKEQRLVHYLECESDPYVVSSTVLEIGCSAFSYCMCIRKVVLPQSVQTISAGAFAHCKNLCKVTFSDHLRTIGDRAFSYCSELDAISLPESLEYIGCQAFYCCEKLTSVVLPSLVHLVSGPFGNCKKLSKITVHADNPAFKTVDDVLFTSDGKKLLQFPPGSPLEEYTVPDSVEVICSDAFCGCENLKTVKLQQTLRVIVEHAFAWCRKMVKIQIPDSVQAIGTNVFADCNEKIEIDIPSKFKDRDVLKRTSDILGNNNP